MSGVLVVWPPAAVIFFSGALLATVALNHSMLRYSRLLPWTGLLIHLALFASGNALAHASDELARSNHFTHLLSRFDQAIVHVQKPPQSKGKNLEIHGKVLAIRCDSLWIPSFGRTLVYLLPEDPAPSIRYGDLLRIMNTFQPPSGPRNPMAFDFSRYLRTQQIHSLALLRDGQWQLLPLRRENGLKAAIFRLQALALKGIERHISSQREASVVQALSIGYRENMAYTLRQMYSHAGVIHLLAVSGLHVGILYASLLALLGFLKRYSNGKVLLVVLVLATIWLFALVCGLPASVWRASTMFSLLLIGNTTAQKTNTYNLLAASALIILIAEPRQMLDIGMQLSYGAMVGIQSLYSGLNRLLPRTNRLVDHIWKISAVSISAQVGTLPLTLFYFHQFPVYFLLANVPLIPLAALLLNISLLLIVLQFIPPAAWALGFAAEKLSWLLNEYIYSIYLLPGAVWMVPYLPVASVVFLAVALIGLIGYFKHAAPSLLIASLTALLLMLVIQGHFLFASWRQPQLVVYSLRQKSCVDLQLGRKTLRLASSAQATPQEAHYLNTLHCLQGREQPAMLPLEHFSQLSGIYSGLAYNSGYFRWGRITGYVCWEGQDSRFPPKALDVDILVVTGLRQPDALSFVKRLKPETVIADRATHGAVVRALRHWCRQDQIDFHHTQAHAAIVQLTQSRAKFGAHP